MTYALNMHDACRSLVATGMSKSDTKIILSTLDREQKGSGSDFLLDRLKTAKLYCENKITQASTPDLPWFRKTKAGSPKDMGWRKLLENTNPEKSLQSVSVLIMDMKRTPDQKTKEKIYENVCQKVPSSPKVFYDFTEPNNHLLRLFSDTEYPKFPRQYGPDTLQGTSFPLYGGEPYRVQTDSNGAKDKDSVLTMCYEGLCSAPISLADHLLRKSETLSKEAHSFDFLGPEISSRMKSEERSFSKYLDELQDIVRVEAFDNGSNLDDYGGDLSKTSGNPNIVGCISVIPSPGMKDRVIANPNPAVQSALYNLGEYLGEVTRKSKYSFVHDQDAGILEIQRGLELGYTLASIDLTAATDRLSARAGFQLLRELKPKANVEQYLEDIDYFEEVSRSSWYIGNLGTDGIEYISYRQGQPMGLKPSFPTLTLMNIKAGMDATAHIDRPFGPVVVGDDIVIDARALPRYLETIEGLGGEVNMSKTLVSNTHAKFCSRLITKDNVIRLKPRYIESDRMQNALQFGNLDLLKPWERTIALSAASQSIDELDHIYLNVDKSPLISRITNKAVQRLSDSGTDLSLYILQPETAKLSLYLRREQETDLHQRIVRGRAALLEYEMGKDSVPEEDSMRFIDHLDEVVIPVDVSTYDHHIDARRKKRRSQDITRVRKISKSPKHNEITYVSDLDGHEGTIIYDDDTLLYQPKSGNNVHDLSHLLQKEQEHIAQTMSKKPTLKGKTKNFSDVIANQRTVGGIDVTRFSDLGREDPHPEQAFPNQRDSAFDRVSLSTWNDGPDEEEDLEYSPW